jgi:hypothetical protein
LAAAWSVSCWVWNGRENSPGRMKPGKYII